VHSSVYMLQTLRQNYREHFSRGGGAGGGVTIMMIVVNLIVG
jgi:hypothetical protein